MTNKNMTNKTYPKIYSTGVEKSLILSYEGRDEMGECISFFNAELAIDTKHYKKGDIISLFTVENIPGMATLYDAKDGRKLESFKIHLTPEF